MSFNVQDPANMGRPIHFDLNDYVKAIIGQIRSDEIQNALWMLDNPPAWYRKNYPPELAAIKNALYRGLYSSIEYATDNEELEMALRVDVAVSQWRGEYCFPRAKIITDELRRTNADGRAPFIVDLGCSHGNLPLGLMDAGGQFNYLGLAMNKAVVDRLRSNVGKNWAEQPLEGQETWLVCTEVLEHCMDPMSLVIDAYKPGFHYHQMFWSTPFGCLYGGLENWDSRRLGHVRGWTDTEFIEFVNRNFPGFDLTCFISNSMVIHGRRK